MRVNFLTRLKVSAAALAGLGLAASVLTVRAHADQWDKKTMLTFNEPTQVSNTYLEPGTYMFILVTSSPGERHIVQIYTGDRSRLINTVLAIPSYHMNAAGDTEIAFWETPPGMAKAVRTWTYPGDNYGQEFPYPTNLRQVGAVTASASAIATPPAIKQPAPAATTAMPPAAPVAIAQTAPVETAPQPAPVEIAQNTPQNTPQDNAGQNNAAPQPSNQSGGSQTLPKTASLYPLSGLVGLLSLAGYTALRVKA